MRRLKTASLRKSQQLNRVERRRIFFKISSRSFYFSVSQRLKPTRRARASLVASPVLRGRAPVKTKPVDLWPSNNGRDCILGWKEHGQ